MGRDITFVNQGNRLMLQAIEGYYQAPLSELKLEEMIPQYKNMTLNELKAYIDEDFVDGFVDGDGNKLEYWDDTKVHFFCRDGKSDVYTKGGLDYAVFEYLGNQVGESQKWRIETNATHIDFKAGGKITIGDEEYRILKVLTIITSGTRPNKFLAMKTPTHWARYSTKMLALI